MAAPRILIDESVGDPERFRERRYLIDLLNAAFDHPSWPTQVDTAVVLSAHARHAQWPSLEQSASPPLIIAIGDEDAQLRPALIQAGAAIVQQYVADAPDRPTPIFNLPLGPGGDDKTPPIRPWQERDIDIVFIGHLHRRRWALARGLGAVRALAIPLPDTALSLIRRAAIVPVAIPDCASHIQFTERFGGGQPRAEYLSLLSRARIALVPQGFKQAETFRHYEAARAGCVLVGTALPTQRLPVLSPPTHPLLSDWLRGLLRNPVALEAQHRAVVQAWTQRGRASSVGHALAQKLQTALLPTAGGPSEK